MRVSKTQSIGPRLLITVLLVGFITATITGLVVSWTISAIVGWAAAGLMYLLVVWANIQDMTAEETSTHAASDAPGRRATHLLLVGASVASLMDLITVMLGARHSSSGMETALPIIAVFSTVVSWVLVHTVFTLHYAQMYQESPNNCVSFPGNDSPCYRDFAYLAFTIGMTYQVSDTAIIGSIMRRQVLRHALISYVFGAVVLAAMVNLMAGLVG